MFGIENWLQRGHLVDSVKVLLFPCNERIGSTYLKVRLMAPPTNPIGYAPNRDALSGTVSHSRPHTSLEKSHWELGGWSPAEV